MSTFSNDQNTKGFSLVEILIVIVILSVLSSIAIPNFIKFQQNRNLQEAVGALMADLKFARQSAMTQGVNYTVTLNPSNETYRVQGGTYDVTKKVSDFGSKTQIYWTSFPYNKVTFQPRGTLVETGTYSVLLRNKRDSCIHVNVNLLGRVTKTIHQIK